MISCWTGINGVGNTLLGLCEDVLDKFVFDCLLQFTDDLNLVCEIPRIVSGFI